MEQYLHLSLIHILKSPIDAKLVILYNGMEEEIVLNAGSSYQKTLI